MIRPKEQENEREIKRKEGGGFLAPNASPLSFGLGT